MRAVWLLLCIVPLAGCARLRSGPVPLPPSLPEQIPVFYATDRAPVPFEARKCEPQEERDRIRAFATTPEERLSYGVYPVLIRKEHRIGGLAEPLRRELRCRQPKAKPLEVARPVPQEDSEFWRALAAEVAASPRREVLVFIHGFNFSFEAAAQRAAQLRYDLGFEGPVVLFSWASRASPRRYPQDELTVAASGARLRTFLEMLRARNGAESVHLLAHSMGNRALVDALAEMPDGKHFGQVILAAPDMDVADFRAKAPALVRLARRVTLYASVEDRPLLVAAGHHKKPRAGESGENVVVVTGVDTIDVSAVREDFLGHSYYGDNRSVLSDMYRLLRDDAPPATRFRLFRIPHGDGFYWAFRP